MTLTEQVCNQVRLMDPGLAEENQVLLEAVCASAVNGLLTRLRENVTPEDCRAEFTAAAAMYALAAMSEVGSMAQLEQVTAGDLTVRRAAGSTTADTLRRQAERLMGPYVREPFLFMGV